MIPTFFINKLAAQNRSENFDKILDHKILKDIAKRLTGSDKYKIVWENERNKGRLITLETDSEIDFINLSQNGVIQSRNNYFQSVATAFGIYLKSRENCKKGTKF